MLFRSVNGHLLDQARFAKDGEVVYQHDVPVAWLSTTGLTTVRMRIHNPYIAPRDGARLGVVLRSAMFAPAAGSGASSAVSAHAGTPRETSPQ